MKHWQQYSRTEQIQILDITSAEMALPRLAVEKDWWVIMVLKALSSTTYASIMSFKGGTSLSKGWHLIQRFSEDIDIALKREDRFAINSCSNTQLAKAKRAARHYIIRELPNELEANLQNLGISGFNVEAETSRERNGVPFELRADTHPSVIYVNYNSIVPEISEYLLPRVKIEISCLSMDEPVEEKNLTSFISEKVKDVENVSVNFKTVIPTRTFLEKIFLLHEEFQKKNPRSFRMSRHLYDIEKIMDTKFGYDAISNKQLYQDIITHRSVFNNIPDVDYSTHSAATLNFIPPIEILSEWDKDYNMLTNHFIYYNETKLTFEKLIERMNELKNRFRTM